MHVYCVADILVACHFKVLSLSWSPYHGLWICNYPHTHTHTKWLHKSPRFGPFCRGRDCKCPTGIWPQWAHSECTVGGYSGRVQCALLEQLLSSGYMSTARVAFSHCSIVNTTTRNDIDRHVSPLPLLLLPSALSPLPSPFPFLFLSLTLIDSSIART